MHKYSIVFFGNEQLAQGLTHPITPIFEALLASQHQIKALILPSKNPKKPFPIEKLATANSIPVFYTKDKTKILSIIQKHQPDLGVLASFGQIVPKTIINSFPHGILNVHPSLLPKYRGTTPIESAILNGDKTTGVSIMQLVRTMDAGPILAQKQYQIPENINKQQLYEELSKIGAKLLTNILNSKTQVKNYPKTSQSEATATFTKPLNKDLSRLEPSTKPAMRLAHEIRAYLNFPKSKLSLLGLDCTITAANLSPQAKTILDPICNDGSYLVIEKLIPPGRKEMTATDFLRGYHKN